MAKEPIGVSPSGTFANANLDTLALGVTNAQGSATAAAASAASAAASAAAALAAQPGNGRTVPDLPTYLLNNAVFNVKDYGAKGDNATDDTSAIALAITKAAAASPNSLVLFPPGQYVVSSTLNIPTTVQVVGYGSAVSTIVFAPTANGTCMKVSAGASQALKNRVVGIGFYSADTTWTKVALQLSDCTSALVDDIYISGAGAGTPAAPYWTGGGNSVGIQTNGREASSVSNVRVCADIPILIAANPNTLPTNGEDLDHWHFFNCYLIAKGNPCIKVADGLGVMQLTFDGYQAWVGGSDGFHLNDTRVAPTVPSRGISFHNVRREQSQTLLSYAWNITCTQPALDISWDKCLADVDSQGISFSGVTQAILRACVLATPAGKNALLTAGALGGATIDIQGCYFFPGSNFTPTGYNLILAPGFDSSVTQGPSTAFYANVVAGSQAFIEKITGFAAAGIRSIIAQANANGDALDLAGQAAGSGGTLRAVNAAATDFTPMTLEFSTLALDFRTGVGTVATAASVDTNGSFIAAHKLQSIGAFACNNASPQTPAASGGALNAYSDGTHGLDTLANMQALYTLVVNMRAALVANGIMS
jgi:hypothetical protein